MGLHGKQRPRTGTEFEMTKAPEMDSKVTVEVTTVSAEKRAIQYQRFRGNLRNLRKARLDILLCLSVFSVSCQLAVVRLVADLLRTCCRPTVEFEPY